MQGNAYDLYSLGWTTELSRAYARYRARGLVPARVGAQRRGELTLYNACGDLPAGLAGRLRRTLSPAGFAGGRGLGRRPSRGGGGRAAVEAVLPRRSAFMRAATDMTRPGAAASAQVVAANVDVALVVADADRDLNARRLERYLASAWESGARPVVLVTKVDLVPDPGSAVRVARAAAPGVRVVPVSNVTGEGVDAVRGLLAPGRTAALLGSSGVGKSTLVNRLLGSERRRVASTRADGRGRHTASCSSYPTAASCSTHPGCAC